MDSCDPNINLSAVKDQLKWSWVPDHKLHICNKSIIRTTFRCEKEVIDFLTSWAEDGHVTWRITRTNPNDMSAGIKNIFYAEYHCQSAAKGPHKKHTNCPARLIITIKKSEFKRRGGSRSKDKYHSSYPTIIKLINQHNHALESADNLRFKDVSEELKNKFKQLFADGHSPQTALDLHKEDLLINECENYAIVSADRSRCPDLDWCYRFYHAIRKQVYGKEDEGNLNELLTKKLSSLDKNYQQSMNFEMIEGKPVIAICTPLMKRIHSSWEYCKELIFIDSTGNFDRNQHRVFVIITHSFVGALPLGIIITTTERADILENGLRLLLGILGDAAFYGKKEPENVMSDNSASERKALKNVFPNANLLLCTFHIMQAFWRYVWANENNVDKNDKTMIYQAFKRIVYSNNEEDFGNNYESFIELAKKYEKIINYMSDMYNNKESWALYARKSSVIRGNNTNNYCEATMRILKDKIFHRKKAYNIVQLIDFILTRVDNYYEKKLLDAAIGKDIILQSRYILNDAKTLELEVTKVDDETFIVYNTKKGTTYWVNMELEQCTCPVGSNGAPCKHQNIVIKKNPTLKPKNFYSPNERQRKFLHLLATGNTNFPENFYAPLNNFNNELQDGTSHNDQNEHTPLVRNIDDVSPSHSPDVRVDSVLPDMPISENDDYKKIKEELSLFSEVVLRTAETKEGQVAWGKFFQHFKKNSKTEAALYSTLHQFGRHTHGKFKTNASINAQSTSISRRKSKLGGVNRLQSGRPTKKNRKEHTYSSLGKKKVAAPHCLTARVENNIA